MPDYTGLGALAWAQFSVDKPGPDQRFFQGIIEQNAGPALEVGCGTGRLLECGESPRPFGLGMDSRTTKRYIHFRFCTAQKESYGNLPKGTPLS
jgi:hypothetical protein